MNKLIWKLLSHHLSAGQLAGFFLANLFGMTIVLLGWQFYRDVLPVFTQGDSFLQKDYIVLTKRVSTLGGLTGGSNTFSADEIDDLRSQPFTRSAGGFTPSLFKVRAGVSFGQAGTSLATDMFFEAVPDRYVDIRLEKWHYTEGDPEIPIIVPRNYLNLYNFGFAQTRGLPKMSEGLLSRISLDITLRGGGRTDSYRGVIAGFSSRLNTILVPESFIKHANALYAPGREAEPSRLIVEVDNPANPAIATYFDRHRYDTEGNNLDAGRTTHFLQIVTAIVIGVGLVISLLSFYILMLSIYLLLQKNTDKLQNLLLVGYRVNEVALPYCTLTTALNGAVCLLALTATAVVKGLYAAPLQLLLPGWQPASALPVVAVGLAISAGVSLVNIIAIRQKIKSLSFGFAETS